VRAASLFQAATDPEVFEGEEAHRSLWDSVLHATHELLFGVWGGSPSRALRGSTARHRIIRTAFEYLDADPRKPVSTADLCAAVGVSPARLRAAFLAASRVGPQRCLKLRRLAMVRAALRQAHPHGSTLRDLALAHGFWHFRRFALDYQAMFGAAPS